MPFDPKFGCAPPVCCHVTFDRQNLAWTYFDTQAQKPLKKRPKTWQAGDAQKEVDKFAADRASACDGCGCLQFPATPWQNVPRALLPNPLIPNDPARVQVSGLRVRSKWGVCCSPGTKISRDGGKTWRELPQD